MKKILTTCNVLLLGIASLLTSCDKFNKSNEKTDVTITNSSKEYFEGIIKFEETNLVGSFSKVSITLKDEGVQRDVVPKFNMDNENYGILYKKGEDSVYYYFSKKEKSYYTLIPKKDFKNWVLSLEKPKSVTEGDFADSFDGDAPFGLIFSPFSQYDATLLSTNDNPLDNLPNSKSQTFLLGKHVLCNVWYDETIKVKPEILELIEHHQPTSIRTIALQVLYSDKKDSKTGKKLEDKILSKMDKLSVKIQNNMKLKSITSNKDAKLELPKNSNRVSMQELSNIIYPPQNTGGDGGSHHDFDLL